MTDLTNAIAVGTDDVVPIYDPEGPWKIWALHEIYRGAEGYKRFIPKVKDYVVEVETYTMYIVDHLDPVTLIPTLRQINPNGAYIEFSQTDILFGVGPGTPSETYRVYLDKSTTPYTMHVDAFLTITGSASKYAKIYRVTSTGEKLISKMYDARGQFVSDTIPLELITSDSHETHVVKAVPTCYTMEDMPDGEIVMVVFYSEQGKVVSKRPLIVENTTFIPSANHSKKYITHISMDSVFISDTNPDVIMFPLNVPINALNLMGTVYYSDGSTMELPVDGNKFKIFGLDQFTSSIVGQKIDLVLAYSLGLDEAAFAGVGLESNIVTAPYTLIVDNPNNSYAVKLFSYPEWVSASEGYRMRHWLYNLDRNIYQDVTAHVKYDENRGLFDPLGYGFVQQKSISLNLRDISAAFKPFIYTQPIAISLRGDPVDNETPWTVTSNIYDTVPYGRQLRFKRTGVKTYDLISNCADKAEWLRRFYYESQPLVDRTVEVKAPEPTHFVVMYGNQSTVIAINDWNSNIVLERELDRSSSVYIRFIRRAGTEDIQLGISGVTVKY